MGAALDKHYNEGKELGKLLSLSLVPLYLPGTPTHMQLCWFDYLKSGMNFSKIGTNGCQFLVVAPIKAL